MPPPYPSQSSPVHRPVGRNIDENTYNAHNAQHAYNAPNAMKASNANTVKSNNKPVEFSNNWCDDEKINPLDIKLASSKKEIIKEVKRQVSTLEIGDLNVTHRDKETKDKIKQIEEARKKECEDLELKKIELEYKLIHRQHLLEIELLKKKLEETERAMTSIIAKMDEIPPQQKVS